MLKTQLGGRVVPICLKATFSFGTLAAAGRLEIAGPSMTFGGPPDLPSGVGLDPAALPRARDQSASQPLDLCQHIHALS